MYIPINCMTCFQEDGRPTDEILAFEFLDGGRYEHVCSRGHKTITVLQQQKYEVLFEMGLHAILDGYYREGVSAFAASLERFDEFAVRVLMYEATGNDDVFQAYCKEVKLSERQLGGFAASWALKWKEPAVFLPGKLREFRNNVIHRGVIPTRTQAIEFGESTQGVIQPALTKLRTLRQPMQAITHLHMTHGQEHIDPIFNVSSASISTLLGQGGSFAQRLNELANWKRTWRAYEASKPHEL